MKILTNDDLIKIAKQEIKISYEEIEKMQQLVNNLYEAVDSSPDNKIEAIKLPWESCMSSLFENKFQESVSFLKYIDRIMGDARLAQIKNYNLYMDILYPTNKKRKVNNNKGE